ncbi:MAG: SDR family NAD(P)-dependent oxidoreductase, partial [Enterococcus faecium]
MVTNKKVVFITGGTRGIGKQTARIFAKAGYQLALNYQQNKKQEENFQE